MTLKLETNNDAEQQAVFMHLLDQFPLIWAKRRGGSVRIHADEVKAVESHVLDITSDGDYFVLTLRRKD